MTLTSRARRTYRGCTAGGTVLGAAPRVRDVPPRAHAHGVPLPGRGDESDGDAGRAGQAEPQLPRILRPLQAVRPPPPSTAPSPPPRCPGSIAKGRSAWPRVFFSMACCVVTRFPDLMYIADLSQALARAWVVCTDCNYAH